MLTVLAVGTMCSNLDSGIFTCFTPGYYTVSFSAHARVGTNLAFQDMSLYKNGTNLPESYWLFGRSDGAVNGDIGVTGFRIVVSYLLGMFD